MIRKTVSQFGLSYFVLFMLFPCFSQAKEGVEVLNPLPAAAGAATVPTATINEIPVSANQQWAAVCVDPTQNLNGDFQQSSSAFFIADGQWSVGPAVSTQLIKYDFGKKKAGFNTSLGAGAAFRFYRNIPIKDPNNLTVAPTYVPISQVKPACRQTSFGKNTTGYLAAPMFSITPTIFASEPIDQDDLSVQPAILLGFFEDILNVGVGFNLTGPAGEKGNVFMLMSIGAGFDF